MLLVQVLWIGLVLQSQHVSLERDMDLEFEELTQSSCSFTLYLCDLGQMSFEPLFSHWQNGAGGRCEARGTVFEKAFCKTEMTMQKTKVIIIILSPTKSYIPCWTASHYFSISTM